MSGTGPDRELTECAECLEPAEAFSIIGNEIRLDILEALWAAEERPISFSELRRSVGVDDSAQFNYHLGELRGQFVRKTDEGYDFRWAGLRVVHAILAGSFNEDPVLEPFPVEGECPVCGDGLQARYRDETLAIECRERGHCVSRYPFPPGGLRDRTGEEIATAYDQRVRHLLCLAADGVCWSCNGRRRTEVMRASDDEECQATSQLEVLGRLRCEQCGHVTDMAVGLALLDDPDVVTFYRDHGIDLADRPHWTLEWCVSDDHTTVLSEDPWRIRVAIPLDDEVMRVTLDGDLAAVDVTTRARAEAGSAASGV